MTETRPLYLVRHGQTAWNVQGRLQGGKDSPLTDQGKRQASAIASSLRTMPPIRIFTSPLGRASRTAAVIGEALETTVEEDARLGELRFGSAEGLTLSDIDERWPDFRERRERDKWQTSWPDGESYHDADVRVAPFVSDVLAPCLKVSGQNEGPASPIAVVGHETMNMILIGRLLQLHPSMVVRIGQPNHVVYRLQGRLVDHAHLGDDDLDWIPGLLQKRSDTVLHIAA